MWSLVNLGPPDFPVVDQSAAHTSLEMRESLEAYRVRLDEPLIETSAEIGTVERYHAPLTLVYEQIRTEAGVGTSDQECLQLAAFVKKWTIGSDVLFPALLDTGAVPRPGKNGSCS